jgi:hypothetical protein
VTRPQAEDAKECGFGGSARLPHEGHGYAARESVEHVLYELLTWFDKHVKNAK